MSHLAVPQSGWAVLLATSLAAGAAGGLLSSRMGQNAPGVAGPVDAGATGSSASPALLAERIDELEEQCAFLMRQARAAPPTASATGQQPAAAATGSMAMDPANPQLEAMVRTILRRWDDERYESEQARRVGKQESRVRGFVSTVATKLGLAESKRRDVEAILIAKGEEWRDAKDAFNSSEETAQLTARQRKEARQRLEERANEALNAALSDVLTTEQLHGYQALVREERFDWD